MSFTASFDGAKIQKSGKGFSAIKVRGLPVFYSMLRKFSIDFVAGKAGNMLFIQKMCRHIWFDEKFQKTVPFGETPTREREIKPAACLT
jgi:hypothetical protein